MKTNNTNAQRWLYCIGDCEMANNIWSRLNLEAAGITWAGNPARARRSGFLELVASLLISDFNDNQNWTSESDALGERGVVWRL
jgi:hypothetical protein